MKTLISNKIEEKPSKDKKIKDFLAITLLSASLIFSGCEGKLSNNNNEKENNINDIENVENNEKEFPEEKNNLDKENNDSENEEDLDENDNDSEGYDLEENDNDSEEGELNEKENNYLSRIRKNPKLKEEFDKSCPNIYTVTEEFSKYCIMENEVTANGASCKNTSDTSGKLRRLHCETKKAYNNLIKQIQNDNPSTWIDKADLSVEERYNEIKILFRYGEETFSLHEINPEVGMNDLVNGYSNNFEYKGKKFDVLFVDREKTFFSKNYFKVKDSNGIEANLYILAHIQAFDLYAIELTYGLCTDSIDSQTYSTMISTIVLMDGKETIEKVNEDGEKNNWCKSAKKENFEIFKEKVKNNEIDVVE